MTGVENESAMAIAADVERLLDELAERRRAWLAAAERFGPSVAPGFSPFALFAPGETTLSALIAHLLDPKGSHAQGDLFLRLLLEHLAHLDREVSSPDLEWPETASRDAVVTVERPARMDVFVEGHADGRGYRLAIENKLRGAGDRSRQIAGYFEAIEGRAAPGDAACVVYLSIDREEPTEFSFPKDQRAGREERLRCMNAEHFAEWLEDCRARARSPAVAAHAAAFRTYVQTNLLAAKDIEMDEIVDMIAGKPDRTEAFIRSLGAEDAVRKRLLAKFKGDLERTLERHDLMLSHWTLDPFGELPKKRGEWSRFDIARTQQHGAMTVSVEFAHSKLRTGVWGVRVATMPLNAGALHEAMVKRFLKGWDDAPGRGGPEDAWLWWRPFADTYNEPLPLPPDWWHAPKVWGMMADGRLAERIVRTAKEAFDVANSI